MLPFIPLTIIKFISIVRHRNKHLQFVRGYLLKAGLLDHGTALKLHLPTNEEQLPGHHPRYPRQRHLRIDIRLLHIRPGSSNRYSGE